jgi:tRNA uridine 5-carbamoylmethylation protein Kti12
MRVVASAASGYAAAGYFTIVDGIVIPAWFLKPLRAALSETGQPVAYAVLRAPLQTCIDRAERREGPFLAEPDVIRQLWESFADLGELEPNAVELGAESPEAVADIVATRLEAGELRL